MAAQNVAVILAQRVAGLEQGKVLDVTDLKENGTGTRIKKKPKDMSKYYELVQYPVISKSEDALELFAGILGMENLSYNQPVVMTEEEEMNAIKAGLVTRLQSLDSGKVLNVTKMNESGVGARAIKRPTDLSPYYVIAEYPVVSKTIEGAQQFASIFEGEQLSFSSEPRDRSESDKMTARLADLSQGQYLDVTRLTADGVGARKRKLPVNLEGWMVMAAYPVMSKSQEGLQTFAQIMGLSEITLRENVQPAKPKRTTSLLDRIRDAAAKGRALDVSKIMSDGKGARIINTPTARSKKIQVGTLPVYSSSPANTEIFLQLLDMEDPSRTMLSPQDRAMSYYEYFTIGPGAVSATPSVADLLSSVRRL